jgi:hypothetical protein
MQYLTNLIAFLLPALSSLRLSIVEDNDPDMFLDSDEGDEFFSDDNQDNADATEDNFDWSTVPEQSYPAKPDLPTNTPIQAELYEVQTKGDSITLMYRNSEHEGLASENYTIFNGNQAFVLNSWDKRFAVKSVEAPESTIKDAIKKHMKSFQGQTATIVLDPRTYSDEIYNVNPIKSAKAHSKQ